jgi:catecholate siderophore receptor
MSQHTHDNPYFQMRPLCAALLVALTAPSVSAQEQKQEQVQENRNTSGATGQLLPAIPVYGEAENDYATGVTTIGGAAPAPIRDVPQSVTVINRAVLDAQAATTLTEALRNTPGITLSAGEGGQIGDNVNIRGFNARTDLFLDGVRDRGQYSRETFFLESLEVVRGPSSMLFGRGSTGGVINQVSKQASLRDHAELGLSIGTDAYYRATLDVNRKLSESSAWRVAVLGHANESTRDVIESERSGIAGSLRFGIDTDTQIGLSAMVQRRKDIPDYGFPFAAGGTEENPAQPVHADRDNFYGYTDDAFDQDANVLGVRVDHRFSPAFSLRNHTQYSKADVHAAPTVIVSSGARNRRDREIDDESLYNQTDLVIRFDGGGIAHTVTAGVEIGWEYYENQAYDWVGETAQDFANPVYGPMPESAARTRTTLSDNESETLGVYLNDQMDLGRHWKLVLGVRNDDFEFSTMVTDGNTGDVTVDVDQNDSMTSYRGGIIYQPDDSQSYYVSYGTSFNPSAETLTLHERNQDVDPEKNRSVEIGAKWDLLEGNLSLTTAVFKVEKTNARSVDPATLLSQLDGEVVVDGFEFGASGRLTGSWRIFAGYTKLDGEIVDLTEIQSGAAVSRDGNTLANTPEHTASLWTAYEFGGTWEVGGGAVYSSERLVNNANTSVVDAYTRYDATVAWHGDGHQLRLNLLNLSDEKYFEVASGGRATPATGAAAILTWTADF